MENEIVSKINGLMVDYVCESCKTSQQIPIFPYIDFSKNPEYYAKVKDLDIFKVKCKKCEKQTYIKFDTLLVNPKLKYFIYLFCNKDKINVFRNNTNFFVENVLQSSQYNDWKSLKTRVVTTLNELVEKLCIFELGLNDIAIELIKCGFFEKEIISNDYEVYFDGINDANLEFITYNKEKNEKIKISIGIYNKIIDKLNNISLELQDFELIDQEWIKTFKEKYK